MRLAIPALFILHFATAAIAEATFAQDQASVLLAVSKNKKYGFINATGKIVVPIEYDQALYVSEGFAAVNKGGGNLSQPTKSGTRYCFGGGDWGFVDVTGKVAIPLAYADARSFSGGLAAVKQQTARGMTTPEEGSRGFEIPGRWGFIDKTGKTAVEFIYDEIRSFEHGRAAVKRAGKWGLVDPNGKEIIPCQYAFVFLAGEGRAWINIDGTWDDKRERISGGRYRLLNLDGKEIVDKDFQGAQVFGEGLAPVELKGRWGFVGPDGKLAIQPAFEFTSPFSEGLARFGQDLKFGFIDRNGKVVIKPEYPRAFDFREGLAAVNVGAEWYHAQMLDGRLEAGYNGGLWGFIDRTGKMIVEPKYTWVWGFSEGLAQVQQGEKAGFVDKKGTEVVTLKFHGVGDFTNGRAPVWIGSAQTANQTWIDRSGHCLWNPGE